MGVGSGGLGAKPLWIFIHGTDIVYKGLVLFFGLFFAIFRSFFCWPPWKRLNSVIFGLFSFYQNIQRLATAATFDVWALAQSRRDGHCSLVTPERILSEYNEDLI